MILLAGSLDIGASPIKQQTETRATMRRLPGGCCLRCGGLLVLSYTASLELDVTGTPVTLWRCVNCGNCVDHAILVNR
jgi:RNase P subunit RPR2